MYYNANNNPNGKILPSNEILCSKIWIIYIDDLWIFILYTSQL